MAAEIFMSCTCTSVVRGTAAGLCFLPSPRPRPRRSLSGTPSYLGQVKLRPASMGTQPCLPPWEHLHGLSPSYWGQADPPRLALSLPCPIVMNCTCVAVAACLTLCALLELCKGRLVAHLFLCFPRGLAWCGFDLERGPLCVGRIGSEVGRASALPF